MYASPIIRCTTFVKYVRAESHRKLFSLRKYLPHALCEFGSFFVIPIR